ncbi:hypothetical protein [Nocardia sp. NBC_01388]|uniref:hypothetical protein n=1 Tax=Nocardia sp. NBC_01388 TaxID=2903596 RepID=UPI003246F32A
MDEALNWLNGEWEPPASPIEGAAVARTVALQKIAKAAALLEEAEAELQEVIQRHRTAEQE